MNKDGTNLGVRAIRQEPAKDAAEVGERHAANRVSWNEAALVYSRQVEATIEFLRAGKSSLHPIERRNLGDLRSWCKTAVHLQCASGRDTLSLWNEGIAEVIGVDISEGQIANAKKTSSALNIPARWYCCDVLAVPEELHGCADLVITGQGSINWIHDLKAWGMSIRRILKPGGVVHLLDDHPVCWLFSSDAEDLQPSNVDYFNYCERSQGWSYTYIGNQAKPGECDSPKYERCWLISDVFQALVAAGLQVTHLGEYAEGYWNNFPRLKRECRGKIPLTFSIMARSPITGEGGCTNRP